MLLYTSIYYLFNYVEYAMMSSYRSFHWWCLSLNFKKYFLNLFGYGQKMEVIILKNLFLFFILKPFFDLFKIFVFLFKETYFLFLEIIFSVLFDIGLIMKLLGKFKFMFLVLESRYFSFLKSLLFKFSFSSFDLENILNFSLQASVYKIIDKFLLLLVSMLDFFFFNVKFVVGLRKFYVYVRHLYYYLSIGVAYVLKYIYMFILDFFWLLYLWKKYGYMLRFYSFYFYFLSKNKNIMMFLEKFTYNKADILDLSVNLANTESDLMTKLLEKISYMNYFKFIFYKLLKLCFFFSYAFFFVFTMVYFIFTLMYEKIYDKMGMGAGENYSEDVLVYNKKMKEWMEYMTKV